VNASNKAAKQRYAALLLAVGLGGGSRGMWGAQPAAAQDITAELNALKARVAELESQQHENWMTKEREDQIKAIVQNAIADAKKQGQLSGGGIEAGYKDGFYIQSADKNYKLTINGLVQVRYAYVYRHDANTNDTLHPISATSNQEDTSGFDVRRARLNFQGNVVSPNVVYRFYGDFFGASTGAFTVLEAWAGYNFNDAFKIRAGATTVPFNRAAQNADALLDLMSRPEVFAALLGNDTPRAIGVNFYGEPIKDKLNYDVQVNNGINSNTIRRPDTTGPTGSLDNRLGIYGRVNYAGSGVLKDFNDQPDLRPENRDFIWLAGLGLGYESQSAATGTLPSPQNSAVMAVSNARGPGFKTYTLNGDVFRATLDWSAKYQGWSFQTAALLQQVNASAGTGAALPLGAGGPSAFFEQGYYAQAGYMLIPQKLEVVGRVQYLFTEGFPNIGEYYQLGANYYIFGHNAKIQTDITYTPESVYTDAGEDQLQNTHQIAFRAQLQVMF
jgi:phosphate-selective porin OprO and OprP